jgi:curved DNA-binding protein CbpA
MEVLGLRGGMALDRDDISRRFRRLLRDAHPDHGGARADAAERIAELSEARDLLIGFVASAVPAAGD